MLFFQSLPLAGYAYAHWLAGRANLHAQQVIHLAVVALSLVLLATLSFEWRTPLLPDSGWKPSPGSDPVRDIVWLLAIAIGLPFLVLSATNPLLRAWVSIAHPSVSPYRLYALSNRGSLLGLLSYPLLVETWLPLGAQARVWAALYVLFAMAITFSAWGVRPPAGLPEQSGP